MNFIGTMGTTLGTARKGASLARYGIPDALDEFEVPPTLTTDQEYMDHLGQPSQLTGLDSDAFANLRERYLQMSEGPQGPFPAWQEMGFDPIEPKKPGGRLKRGLTEFGNRVKFLADKRSGVLDRGYRARQFEQAQLSQDYWRGLQTEMAREDENWRRKEAYLRARRASEAQISAAQREHEYRMSTLEQRWQIANLPEKTNPAQDAYYRSQARYLDSMTSQNRDKSGNLVDPYGYRELDSKELEELYRKYGRDGLDAKMLYDQIEGQMDDWWFHDQSGYISDKQYSARNKAEGAEMKPWLHDYVLDAQERTAALRAEMERRQLRVPRLERGDPSEELSFGEIGVEDQPGAIDSARGWGADMLGSVGDFLTSEPSDPFATLGAGAAANAMGQLLSKGANALRPTSGTTTDRRPQPLGTDANLPGAPPTNVRGQAGTLDRQGAPGWHSYDPEGNPPPHGRAGESSEMASGPPPITPGPSTSPQGSQERKRPSSPISSTPATRRMPGMRPDGPGSSGMEAHRSMVDRSQQAGRKKNPAVRIPSEQEWQQLSPEDFQFYSVLKMLADEGADITDVEIIQYALQIANSMKQGGAQRNVGPTPHR